MKGRINRSFSLTALANGLLNDAAPENASAFVDALICEHLDPQRPRLWRARLQALRDMAEREPGSIVDAIDALMAQT